MDADDGIGGVVLSAEKFLKLGGFDFLLPYIEMCDEIVGDVLPFPRPFQERAHFLFAVVELLDEIEVGPKTAPLAGELLAFSPLGPDVGFREFLIELVNGFF